MSLLYTESNRSPYSVYERYVLELSNRPYTRKYNWKYKCTKYGCNLIPFLMTSPEEPTVPDWTMSDEELANVSKFFNTPEQLGFIGISPALLHDTWEFHMLPFIFSSWCKHLYGDDENIIPDYKNFCHLVKVQVEGSLESKAEVIKDILLLKGYDSGRGRITDIEDNKKEIVDRLKISKYVVMKYFYELMASYMYGLGRCNNSEYLLWESCSSGLQEVNLKIWMKYFTEDMNYHCYKEDIKLLLEKWPLLRTVLVSSVSMMFGRPSEPTLVPFLDMPRQTMLDVSLVTFLTSIIRGEGNANFEVEMIYSQELDGVNNATLHEKIIRQGPTFVVVKDRLGYVFGGYASASWMISTNFMGDDECFVFRLLPNVVICKASTKDNNFMFLNVPRSGNADITGAHGLGMGGAVAKFGLWIDLTSQSGSCSDSCSTWSNFKCLASDNEFVYADLEVWRVKTRGVDGDTKDLTPLRERWNTPLSAGAASVIDRITEDVSDEESNSSKINIM